MKKSVKILSAVMAVVLIFACGVGATLALLHHETLDVVNTFAAQDIVDGKKFVLEEHPVNPQLPNGNYTVNKDGEPTQANTYNVIPGTTLEKDPYVKVTTKLDSYLFIEVIDKLPQGKMTWTPDTMWQETSLTPVTEGAKVYVLKTESGNILAAGEHNFNIIAGEKITVSNDLKPDTDLKNATLTFKAYLVQAAGVDNFTAAWNGAYHAA